MHKHIHMFMEFRAQEIKIIYQKFKMIQLSENFLDTLLVLSDDRYGAYLSVDGRL